MSINSIIITKNIHKSFGARRKLRQSDILACHFFRLMLKDIDKYSELNSLKYNLDMNITLLESLLMKIWNPTKDMAIYYWQD